MLVSISAHKIKNSTALQKFVKILHSQFIISTDHTVLTVPASMMMSDIWTLFSTAERLEMCNVLRKWGKYENIHQGMLPFIKVSYVVDALASHYINYERKLVVSQRELYGRIEI